MKEYTECPKCRNDQLIDYGEMTVEFERSAKTGKLLKRGKDGTFDLTVNVLGQKIYLWFPSYASARNYLRNEESFTGRMKKVKGGVE